LESLDWKEYTTTFSADTLFGSWELAQHPNQDVYLTLSSIVNLLTEDRLKQVDLKDIAYKGFNLARARTHNRCICCKGVRYKKANTSYPGILLDQSSYGRAYTMIDGKHRMMKLHQEKTIYSYFYVLTYNDIREHLRRY
tara:strand:+ start:1418 stop:1834 length:417 start_codon:yes stop_codon:yes gene_type:complete